MLGKLSIPLDRINTGRGGRFLFLYLTHTFFCVYCRCRAPHLKCSACSIRVLRVFPAGSALWPCPLPCGAALSRRPSAAPAPPPPRPLAAAPAPAGAPRWRRGGGGAPCAGSAGPRSSCLSSPSSRAAVSAAAGSRQGGGCGRRGRGSRCGLGWGRLPRALRAARAERESGCGG